MNIRLIALDLDGTLLDSRKRVSPANRRALRELSRRGVVVTLASGRMPSCIAPCEEELGIDCCLMAYNGAACIGRRADGRPRLFDRPLPPGAAGTILDIAAAHGAYVNVYVDDVLYGLSDPALRRYARAYSDHTGAVYEFVSDLDRFRGAQPSKMIFVTEPDRRNALYDEIHPRLEPGIHVVKSTAEYLEFIHPAAHKGSGLRGLCDALGFSVETTAAIGDAENDLELVAEAGVGICLANGEPRTKAAAKVVSAYTNDQDGVAREIERLFLT